MCPLFRADEGKEEGGRVGGGKGRSNSGEYVHESLTFFVFIL